MKEIMMMDNEKKLNASLLLIRLSIFLVMFMWTLDKFINPGHAAKVFEKFYAIPGLESIVLYGVGTIEMIILMLFVAGVQKKYSYGAVLVFHAVSTLSSFRQYLDPFEGGNLLFFAAWPMLAACILLFIFREQDKLTLVSINKNNKRS
jgi:putative oxidoreductase